MTEDTTTARAPKVMDEQTAAALFKVMQRHTDDPATGHCPRCGRSQCVDYRFARVQLQHAGRIMPDQLSPAALDSPTD